jgi:UDP-N-acetylglucosamine--N-acetylmuramyl-(pentapeptide) pyrophosphoryl-undecaprenol N-acetylglucosamine transferase
VSGDTQQQGLRIVVAGGGTAGHIEPALALADAAMRADPTTRIVALGTSRGLEARLVPARSYRLEMIPAVPVPRRPGLGLASVPVRLIDAVRKTAAVLDLCEADVVVGFGGYVAAPAYLAARWRRIPIVVHETNALPGVANRLGARLTKQVAVGTPDCPLRNARYVGIPLRREIAMLDRHRDRASARARLGLHSDVPTLLVFGGSQGARQLNKATAAAVPRLTAAGIQILHVTGPGTAPRSDGYYVAVPYIDRMDQAYAAADMALCRSGAMTCAEVSAVGLPALFVPLPHGNGEQKLNAAPLIRAGGGILVENSQLTGDLVADTVVPLLSDPRRREAMSAAMSALGRRDADQALLDMVLSAASGESQETRGTE